MHENETGPKMKEKYLNLFVENLQIFKCDFYFELESQAKSLYPIYDCPDLDFP